MLMFPGTQTETTVHEGGHFSQLQLHQINCMLCFLIFVIWEVVWVNKHEAACCSNYNNYEENSLLGKREEEENINNLRCKVNRTETEREDPSSTSPKP